MKMNTKIATALMALGLLSAATVAKADTTVSIGGNTYNEVFISGSTAARGNVFDAVSGGLFDSTPTYVTLTNGPAPGTGTGAYTAYGKINGTYYCLCFDFTGSEAGIASLEHSANGLANPIAAGTLNATNGYPNAVIPGTPNPTGFIDPNTAAAFSATADLSMADTSQAVSLSPAPPNPALTDFGCVGAVTFEWVKGHNSSPDSSWLDLTNVTDPELNYLLGGDQHAYFFTGNLADGDDVFAVGRNRASGTHQNTMLDTLHGTTTAVDQFVAASCTYSSSGVLTLGNTNSLVSQGGIAEVFNDGFDSGSGVAATLTCDEAGYNDGSIGNNTNCILLGYVGISDGNTAVSFGGKVLTLNGTAESDGTIENGTYSFWGHEHLYGTHTVDAAVTAVGQALAGTTANHTFGSGSHLAGAFESFGQLGGSSPSGHSTIIDPKYMQADKASDGDAGYSSPIN